jgi:hypothetical protein
MKLLKLSKRRLLCGKLLAERVCSTVAASPFCFIIFLLVFIFLWKTFKLNGERTTRTWCVKSLCLQFSWFNDSGILFSWCFQSFPRKHPPKGSTPCAVRSKLIWACVVCQNVIRWHFVYLFFRLPWWCFKQKYF